MTKDKGRRAKQLVRYVDCPPRSMAEAWQLREGEDASPEESASSRGRSYDLLERTAVFGESVIRFARRIPQNPVTNRLIEQLVGCGTSVGANYCEADDAVSNKDFRHKIGTCRKEAKEAFDL